MAEFPHLKDMVSHFARQTPDKVALSFAGQAVTYQEVDRHAYQIANGLLDCGVKCDERVGFLGQNSHWYFEILFGALKMGGVLCPVNWRLSGEEIAYILNDAGVRVLFIGPEFVHHLDLLKEKVASLETVIQVGEPLETWRAAYSETCPDIPLTDDDAVLQLYTSGTTGHPKGVILSDRAIMAHFRRYDNVESPAWNTWQDDDVSLLAMPVFHIGGTAWGLLGLGAGATGIVVSEFDPTHILELIEEWRISRTFLVPAAMQLLVTHPKAGSVDFSSLKFVLYGASPISLSLLGQCIDVLGCGFVQMYGMTETSGGVVALVPEDHDMSKPDQMRAAGKAMTGIELDIIDEQGQSLPVGQIGEVITRSSNNMSGYWNLPDATAKTIDDQKWLHTGDAGYLDENGFLFIVDRIKDMIISGGENIYPAEVEKTIRTLEGVADVSVIGVPDEKWGEAVKAIVILKPDATLSEDDVIAHSVAKIAKFKCPRSVDFVSEFPRNATGKILKRALRERYWGDKNRNVN